MCEDCNKLKEERDALAAALERANEILKAGGWLYVIDPAKPAALLAARDERIREEARLECLKREMKYAPNR